MTDFSQKKRIVVKVGTSTLAHATGNLNIRRVAKLIEVFSDLKNAGNQVILVSSGAIGYLGRTGHRCGEGGTAYKA